MTSHEVGRRLLAGPDQECYVEMDSHRFGGISSQLEKAVAIQHDLALHGTPVLMTVIYADKPEDE